jgi:serine/threonine-protein kinase
MEKKQIGKYAIVGKVGEGAMGEVFKAHDPVLNRFVAIKTIVSSLDKQDDLRQRFQREAQAAAQLNHPNIVAVYDLGEDKGQIFMAMELLEGTDLREIIRQRKSLTLEEKLRMMEQVCDGLTFAHEKEIVHRDLKPGNLHILPNGQVKIMDFGLARLASSDMTKTGLILGTPNYMSPEQVQAKRVDVRSDVFSLGAVFYELMSYQKPFSAESIHATMFKVVQCEREPLDKLVPDLPQPFIEIVDKALQKEPRDRFQNAGEVSQALQVLRQELGGSSPDVSTSWETVLQETIVADPSQVSEPPPSRVSSVASRASLASRGSAAREGSGSGQKVGSGSRPSLGTLREAQLARSQTRAGNTTWYVGGTLALVVLGAVGYFVLRGESSSEKEQTTSRQEIDALSVALVQSQVQLAQTSLDSKQYRAALDQAETILETDPSNVDAQRIREESRSVLSDLDVAVGEARAALDQGRREDAAAALSRVLAIDPSHPLAAELSTQLNSHFRSQAETARSEMTRSRKAAEGSGAKSTGEFQRADRLAKDSERAFQQGQFAVAAQEFLKARDAFGRASRAAREQTADKAKAEAVAKAEVDQLAREWGQLQQQNRDPAVRRQASFKNAASLAGNAQRMASAGDLGGASQAYRQAMNNLLEAKEQALRTKAAEDARARAAAEARPAPTAQQTPPASPDPPPAPPRVSDEDAIRQVLANYVRAIESEDLSLFVRVKPNLSADERGRLEASFQTVDSHQVDITIATMEIQGSQASVRIARKDTIGFNGKMQTNQSRQIIVFSKGPNGWVIEQIAQAP